MNCFVSPQAATSGKQAIAKITLVCPLACVGFVVGLEHTQGWKLSVWEYSELGFHGQAVEQCRST